VQVSGGFGVDGDDPGAGAREGFNVALRGFDHQVHVAGQAAAAHRGFEDGRAEGDVGHEHAVHHVEVQPVGTGVRGAADLVAQL